MAGLAADEKGVRLACGSCGQVNRVPWSHVGERGTCGKCQAALPAVDAPVEVPSDAAYRAMIEGSSLPILVDYWAPWCGPCRFMGPEIEKVAANRAGRLLVAKVNTEALPAVGEREGILSIPTIAVFERGHRLIHTAGARPAADIEAFVAEEVDL
ncbi:MAG: thioredoxin domain-containing protein [Planctomycetota bacterium]